MRNGDAPRGFALVAATAWLACLAILAGVALPHPEGEARLARDAEYARCLREYSVAISRFVWLNKRDPRDLAELAAASPPVLRRIYRDPVTGRSDGWVLLAESGVPPRVATVSDARASDGSRYADWRYDAHGVLRRATVAGTAP